MKRLFIDIETLPANKDQWEGIENKLKEEIASKYKKTDTIQQKQEEAFRKTSLSGEFGRILCIGFLLERNDDEEEGVLCRDNVAERFKEGESEILKMFWEMVRGFDPSNDQIVGHNVFDFDFKFIYQRSAVVRVKPTQDWSFARYRNQPIFDTMRERTKWDTQDKISLDKMALVLGLPSSKSEEISGDKVYERYEEGKHKLIRDYCLEDVRLTRKIYRRLTFSD